MAGVREQLAEAFGLDAAGQSLVDLTMQAQGVANAYSRNTEVGLGAKVVGRPTGNASEASQDATQAPASKPADTEAVDPILASVAAAQSRSELKTLRAENQQAFTDNPEYLLAWKTRGKALPAGGN